jgi:hypothetical protein
MPARLRSILATAATAVAAALLASTGFVLAQGGTDPDSAVRPAAVKRNKALSVKGSAKRLYPGGTVKLPLTIRNRTRYSLLLSRVRVTVRNARAGCKRKYLKVAKFKTRTRIPKGRSKKVKVKLTLSRAAPDACQAARFPLTYRVSARRG